MSGELKKAETLMDSLSCLQDIVELAGTKCPAQGQGVHGDGLLRRHSCPRAIHTDHIYIYIYYYIT